MYQRKGRKRDLLLLKEEHECLTLMLHYPEKEEIFDLVKLAEDKRRTGKNRKGKKRKGKKRKRRERRTITKRRRKGKSIK